MTEPDLLDLTIRQLLDRHPAARPLLAESGLGAYADPQTLESFGAVIRLASALRTHGVDPGQFRRTLGERLAACGSAGTDGPLPFDEALNAPGGVDLFALLPCPLKVPLEEALRRHVSERLEGHPPFRWCLEGNANNQLDYGAHVARFDSLAEIPDIVITPGINAFFHPPFVERFIRPGHFTAAGFSGDRRLAALGVADPAGHYTMLCTNLLVMVADKERLAGRPVPLRWRDLLEPAYGKSVAIRGNRDGSFCETLLLAVHKEFGMEGVRALARSTAFGWHPSQMVKAAGSGRADAPAVSVMPLFFARTIGEREGVEIVWPADGALVSPVTMLVKSVARERLAPVVEFLTGPEVARICAGAAFPPLHPEVDNGLPADAPLNWIGWDYVRENDIEALISRINQEFAAARAGERL